jgi:hypothetical protein
MQSSITVMPLFTPRVLVGRRVAAFGFAAGYAGAALGLDAWLTRRLRSGTIMSVYLIAVIICCVFLFLLWAFVAFIKCISEQWIPNCRPYPAIQEDIAAD